jgi:hypothetical protein
MSTHASRRSGMGGQALVEFALVVPLLLALLLIGAGDYFQSRPQEKLDTASLEAVASALAAPGGDPSLAMHYIDDTFSKDTVDAAFTKARITCAPPGQANGNNEYIYTGRVVPGTWIVCDADADISFSGSVLGLIWKARHYHAEGRVRVPPYRQCAPGVASC